MGGAVAWGADLPPDHAERMAKGLVLFQSSVKSLLVQHCVKCHGGEKTKADFDLATRDALLRGGSEGDAIKPFSAAESRMLKLMRHEEEPEMPENKPMLADADIAKVAQWIDLGAPYAEPLVAGKVTRNRAVVTDEDRKYWAFQPLLKTPPPDGSAHPVDGFLVEAGSKKGIAMNPPADRRKLVRRAYLDLTGLPPSPEEVEAFLADSSPEAWPKLIDKLLASPRYGERWARHWLDVARFAESSGFEHDYDRPYAYHYRDFVIKALNADMPFDEFARWQIAGDEFAPNDTLAMMATGFLGAGVFPTQITANEVERTRYDALDDMLATTGSAFLGLTIGCSRCHDHKTDPIPSSDYYKLLSTFTTTVRSNIDLELDPNAAAKAQAAFETEQQKLQAELSAYESNELQPKFTAWLGGNPSDLPAAMWTLAEIAEIKSDAGAKFKKLEDNSWLAEGKNGESDAYSLTLKSGQRRLTGIKLEALTHESMKQRGPGRASNGNFALSRIVVTAQPANGGPAKEIKVARAEATHEQNKEGLSVTSSLDGDPKTGWAVDFGGIGKDQAAAFAFAEPVDFEGGAQLNVRMEFQVNTGHNIGRLRCSVFAEGAPRLKAEVIPAAVAALGPKLRNPGQLQPAERETLFSWWKERDSGWTSRTAKLAEHVKKRPKTKSQVMVCAEGFPPIVMHSQGAPFFNETHLLKRGDVNQKQGVVEQNFLQVLMKGDPNRWKWTPPAGSPYSGRRRSLANWLTDVEFGAGTLMARVAVNRLWQHHFGRGLVATPNEFGKAGAQPGNQALLDWLAGELIRVGWKTKPLHRLLMLSQSYQQSSEATPAALAADPENAYFLRYLPHRLEAEAVRDSVLAVCGTLDDTMFGPGTLSEDSQRRSIYFTVKRSRLLNSMVVFDAPEPLVSQGSRPTTTVAPQALLLMNSPQTRRWAQSFAKRVQADLKLSSADDLTSVITRAYSLALGRPARELELKAAAGFLRNAADEYAAAGKADAPQLALTDFCQTVLALNEFVYVD